MRDATTQPAGADDGVAGFSMKKALIIAGGVCLLLVAVGVIVAIALLARGGGPVESTELRAPELRAAPATAVPIATALPAATETPVAPNELKEQVAPATAVPTVTALAAATDAPEAPTVEPAAMPWAEVVRMHEKGQGDDPTGLYQDAMDRLASGDITGPDVVATVYASSSFTTFCALAKAWNYSHWETFETDKYKTVARELNQRLADGWPSRDFVDCSDATK